MQNPPAPRRGEMLVLAIAMALPTLITLIYYRWSEGSAPAIRQGIYAVGKTIQFGLPAVWVGWVCREKLGFVKPTTRGLLVGVLFGLAIFGATLATYFLLLDDAPFFQSADRHAERLVQGLGLASPWFYFGASVFYALCHSLLEEYYWRWFVFGRLRRHWSFERAAVVSSAAFMAHHIVVLHGYFAETPLATAFFSLSVMVGGLVWAWLYETSKSLFSPWISHGLVDAAIFAVGYFLAF